MIDYKQRQRKQQVKRLLIESPELFHNDTGGANFYKYSKLPFVLKDGINNVFPDIHQDAIVYFKENNIAWWGENEYYPSGHLLSSQIQCLNHLFALRKDKEAVLQLVRSFYPIIDDMLPIRTDKDDGFIAFEFIFNNEKLLNEKNGKRGKYLTSIDALMLAQSNDKKILIPVEWKFTESYLDFENKAAEVGKGRTRQERYNQLIERSEQLKTPLDFEDCIYYYEPFYELTRQTLLVEQMINEGFADDYLHVLVVPKTNEAFLNNSYGCQSKGLEQVWKEQLHTPERFMLMDSQSILPVFSANKKYARLFSYLKARYN